MKMIFGFLLLKADPVKNKNKAQTYNSEDFIS